jgi:hypothetical protein
MPRAAATAAADAIESCMQGLTLAHFRAQLEDFRDTSLTLELNFSTFGTHPWVRLAHRGTKYAYVERKGTK